MMKMKYFVLGTWELLIPSGMRNSVSSDVERKQTGKLFKGKL